MRKPIKTRNTIRSKNHYAFNDARGNRIECFTNIKVRQHQRNIVGLRTGKFRISRNDNHKGPRYFINDLREVHEEPNAVAVFDEEHLEMIERHDILPVYVRDELSIYNIGVYYHPNIKKRLVITNDTIYEEKLKA